MNKFTAQADEFLNGFDYQNIDEQLTNFAKKRGLNLPEHQRLIEEVNISIFLRQLDKGIQKHDYELATPVATVLVQPREIKEYSSMKKTASETSNQFVATADMFDLRVEDPLEKTASLHIDSSGCDLAFHEEAILLKQASCEQDEVDGHTQRAAATMSLASCDLIMANNKSLLKIANSSPEEAKYVIYKLASEGMSETAKDIMVDCKHSSFDLEKAQMTLSKEARASTNNFIAAGKNILSIPVNAAKAVYHTGAFALNNKVLVGAGGAGLYIANSSDDNAMKVREQMMLRTGGGE